MTAHEAQLDERDRARKEVQEKFDAWLKDPKKIDGEIDAMAAADHALFLEAITAVDEEQMLASIKGSPILSYMWVRNRDFVGADFAANVKHAVAMRGEALKTVNEWREDLGLEKIDRLPPGIPGDPAGCVLAKALTDMGLKSVEVSGAISAYKHGEDGSVEDVGLQHSTATSEFIESYDSRYLPDLDVGYDNAMSAAEGIELELDEDGYIKRKETV